MKKFYGIVATVIVMCIVSLGLVGCSSTQVPTDPKDAVIDKYGDTQFKITFDAGSLSSPLSDVYYSAKNMPVLPVPEKVGYVFAGWYFDSSLTEVCDVENGDLYWQMKNVTLYPKWEKEAIVNNGTYDIDFSATIDEDSIVKGILADKYGWRNFADDIIASETYIEKNEQGTFLRIQYNCHEKGPIFAENGGGEFEKQAYTVDDPNGRINTALSILDRTSLIQTVYYDISGLDIAEPITLNISYYNWNAKLSEGEERERCSVSYHVTFRITRFIGFSKSFVNTEGKLENGVYVVPTHYTGLDKSGAMLDNFHPVYAYIVAENGHYTLVKPLSAYNSDVLGNLSDNDMINRYTGFSRDFAYFLVDQSKVLTEEQENDYSIYKPALLGATSWGTLTYEFHADTGNYYYTMDLGETLTNDVVLFGGSTGAMEQMFNFPFSYRRLTISYDSMVRITDWDYEPIAGDSYTYSKQVPLYAGSVGKDFENSNADFDLLQNAQLSVRMINLFFASSDGGKTTVKNFDSKMTIAPTTITASGNLSEMQYSFSYFNLTYEAFGYDPLEDGELYSSATNFLNLINTNATNFTVEKADIGKTVKKGEKVDLLSLYTEKVYPTVTESDLSWQGYALDKYGEANFSCPISLPKSFTIEEGVAILFTEKAKEQTRTCLVTLMIEEEPIYEILSKDWQYDSSLDAYVTDSRYKINAYAPIPEIRWTWLGKSYTIYDLTKYDDDEPRASFLRIAVYEYSDGIYRHMFSQLSNGLDAGNIFTMTASKMRLEIRLTNRFGEYRSIWLEYRGEAVGDYTLSCDDNNVSMGELKYDQNEDGTYIRQQIKYTEYQSIGIKNELSLMEIPKFYALRITEGETTQVDSLCLQHCTVYLKTGTVTVNTLSEMWKLICNEHYAVILLQYGNEYGDTVSRSALYNFTVDGDSLCNYQYIKGSALFTGETMSFELPKLADSEYRPILRAKLVVYKQNGVDYVRVEDEDALIDRFDYSASVTFLKEGKYRIGWNFWFDKDFCGSPVLNYNQTTGYSYSAEYLQDVTVNDRNCSIDITYVTDVKHPFDPDKVDYIEKNGYQYFTTTVSMAENNLSLNYSYFLKSKDRLWGWSSSLNEDDRLFDAGKNIGKLGINLQTTTPVIYDLWDEGITIDAYYEVDGEKFMLGTMTYYRPTTGGSYTFSLFDFRQFYPFDCYKDYEIAEWGADAPIFQTRVNLDYVYNYNFECKTTNEAFSNSWNVNEGFTLCAVLKKKLTVSYQAIDGTTGNKLQFTAQPGADKNCLEGKTLAEQITENKLNMLNSVTCTDRTKQFKYWAVYIDGVLTKTYIDETQLEQRFAGKNEQTGKYNSSVVLYAVFE